MERVWKMNLLRNRWLRVAAVLGVVSVLLGACNREQATTVNISLKEWAVSPSASSVPAGTVTFAIRNDGAETHEFVVIRTNLGLLDLPVGDDGSVSEEGDGIEVIDEVEDLAAGKSETLEVELSAGDYVLICNIVEEMEMEGGMQHGSHYQMGMRTSFKVP